MGYNEFEANSPISRDDGFMTRRYFGTDGIRGMVNGHKLLPELMLKVGMATGLSFKRGDHRHRVVIGKDTRRSGYMIENALTAGFTAVGLDVFLLGPMPTPAVAMLTRSLRADLGVMISASHNPFEDNGIKLFRSDGYKLSDSMEHEIEALIDTDLTPRRGAISAGPSGSRKRKPAMSNMPSAPWSAMPTLPVSGWLSIVPTGPPIRLPRMLCGNWGLRFFRYPLVLTGLISTRSAAPLPPSA